MRKRPVKSRNAHIIQAHDSVAQDGRRQGSFLRYRDITGSAGCHHHAADSVRCGYGSDDAAARGFVIIQRMNFSDGRGSFPGKAGNENGTLAVFQHGFCDTDDLFRRFPGAVNDLCSTLAQFPVHVNLGITDILKGLCLQLQESILNGERAVADAFQQFSDICIHSLTSKSRDTVS